MSQPGLKLGHPAQVYLRDHNVRAKKEAARFDDELRALLRRELLQKTLADVTLGQWTAWIDQITARKRDMYAVAEEILSIKPE